MGQYYSVCLRADNGKKMYFDPAECGTGVKLMEHAWWGNLFANAVAMDLWHAPHAVVWAGDYSSGTFPVRGADGEETVWKTKYGRLSVGESQEIYDALHADGPAMYEETVDPGGWTLRGKVLVDHDRREVVACDGYFDMSVTDGGRCVHPLPVLTAAGNGLGGGDYFGSCMEYVGRWCGDRVSVEEEVPKGFYSLPCFFVESGDRVVETAGPYVWVRAAMRRLWKTGRGSASLPVAPEDVPVADDAGSTGLPVSVAFTGADGQPSETEFLIEPENFAGIADLGDFWAAFEDAVGELWDAFSRENGVADSPIEISAPLPKAAGGDPYADLRAAVESLRSATIGIPRFHCAGNTSIVRFYLPVEVSYTGAHNACFETADLSIPRTAFFDGSAEAFWTAFEEEFITLWDRYREENGISGERVYGITLRRDPDALSDEEAARLLPDSILSAAADDGLRKKAEEAVRNAVARWKACGLIERDLVLRERDVAAVTDDLLREWTDNTDAMRCILRWVTREEP